MTTNDVQIIYFSGYIRNWQSLCDTLGIALPLSREEIQQIYDDNAGDTGMAADQVNGFVALVKEIADIYPDGVNYTPGAIL